LSVQELFLRLVEAVVVFGTNVVVLVVRRAYQGGSDPAV